MIIAPVIFCAVVIGIVSIFMRLAAIGAFGAMSFTIGKYASVLCCHWAS